VTSENADNKFVYYNAPITLQHSLRETALPPSTANFPGRIPTPSFKTDNLRVSDLWRCPIVGEGNSKPRHSGNNAVDLALRMRPGLRKANYYTYGHSEGHIGALGYVEC
jgi:hypothetical protein